MFRAILHRGLPVLLFIALIIPGSVMAVNQSSARSVGMGGAFTSLASGVDAYRYNPANLGLTEYRQSRLEVIGFGANINNNAFSLNDYNKYTGAILTNSDKDYILGKIPDEGLTLSANIDATAFAVSTGSIAFSTSGVGLADVSVSKEVFDLLFNGNTFGDTVSVDGSYSDAVGYVAAGISYGVPVYTVGTRQLAVGITANYLRGLGMERVVEMKGLAATHETGFEGEGRVILRTATGGSGASVDIGATLQLDDDYTVGARIKNFLSTLSWKNNPEERGYIFNFDTMTVDNMEGDYVVSDDYTKEIGSFSTNLPSVMNIGVANTSGELLWAVDWEQGFRRAAGASKKPRLSGGLEWYGLLKKLPLRTGFSVGGGTPIALSFGSGVKLQKFYFDIAAVTGGKLIPSSSKGINFALSTGLYF